MDFIFLYKNDSYRLDENLNLSLARNKEILFTQKLDKRKPLCFSADIDDSGVIHIGAVFKGAISYIVYNNGKINNLHLMHLPENFFVTSLIINCEDNLRLNYCVKSPMGCAVIEYTKKGENWAGKNLYTCKEELILKYVKKYKNQCYAVKKDNNSYMLINTYEPDKEMFSSFSTIDEVQGVSDGAVWVSGGCAYFNGGEIAKGDKIFAPDMKRVLVKSGNVVKEYSLESGYSGEAEIDCDAHQYILCVPNNDKRKIISSPFPDLKWEMQLKKGIAEEVYMHQRAIFQMQAEIKSLRATIKRIEDMVKNK